MIKKIGKVLIVLLSVAISATLTIIIFGFITNYINSNNFFNPMSYQNSIMSNNIVAIILPIFLMLVIFAINFIWVWKLTKRFPWLVIGVVIFVVVGINFLFKPSKISGGDVGPYKQGQTVLSFSKVGSIKLHDVVVFKRSDSSMDWIGYVVGLSGDKVSFAFFFPDKFFDGSSVPAGFVAVKFGTGKTTWLVSENAVTGIVWYPFVTK